MIGKVPQKLKAVRSIGQLFAFNMDKCFRKACAHGKQALTMCMGLGCNVCGVNACRIIDSKKERLIAIITNSFIPCNGRFPSLISIISMFFVFSNKILKKAVNLCYDT